MATRSLNIRLVSLVGLSIVGVATALLLVHPLPSRAIQNPTISLDMITEGNTYDDATNSMSVGAIDKCLASPTANTTTHIHPVHVVIKNVEDLIGWQVRVNYEGGQMRPRTVNFAPFTDNNTLQNVSFVNLPLDAGVHRDLTSAANIPASAPGPQTAAFGSDYLATQTFAVSPDTPAKSVPDDTSYSAPSGGVLATLNLQVVGDHSGETLSIDVDDDDPNYPGSGFAFFNGTTSQAIHLPSNALGDGFHAEGAPSCSIPTPTPTQTPAPTPTATPLPTPTASPPPPTPTPAPKPTPATFAVDSTADSSDADANDGRCDDGSGLCTLRAAIEQANVTGANMIAFNIPGETPHTIRPLSPLPPITESVTIDGYTQPGAKYDTYPFNTGSDATLKIEIDGSVAGRGSDGLSVLADGVTIRGLVINRFSGYGMRLGPDATINGNYLGSDFAGSSNAGNGLGGLIITYGQKPSRIEENLISGNLGPGITVLSGGQPEIKQNMIGTASDAVTAIGNAASGILINNANVADRYCCWSNTIAYNSGSGIEVIGGNAHISFTAGSIYSNAGLGIDLGGDGVTPNDERDADSGPNGLQNFPVLDSVKTNAAAATVEGTLDAAPGASVSFYSSATCDESGYGEGQTPIGGTYPVNGRFSAVLAPVPAGHFVTAVAYSAEGMSELSACRIAELARFTVNSTGDDPDFDLSDNGCATRADADECTLRAAIQQANATATPDEIAFNITGEGPHTIRPLASLPPITDRVTIDGYTQPGAIRDTGSPYSLPKDIVLEIELDGSLAGPDSDGLVVRGNETSVPDVIISGLAINRFAANGIVADAAYARIWGNYVGTDITGNVGLGNGGSGVVAKGYAQISISRNLVSGNRLFGIEMRRPSADTGLSFNLTGTNAAGNAAIGNGAGGILLNPIGDFAVVGNLISGNHGPGVSVLGESGDMYFSANRIGTQVDGVAALPNEGAGILVGDHAADVRVYGGNVIAYNRSDGIEVTGSANLVFVSENSIHSNDGLAIDLNGDGVTPNDHLDDDTGPNNLQNFPVLTSATSNGKTTTIRGWLEAGPEAFYGYTLDFYSNAACDASGYGEGEVYLGSGRVTGTYRDRLKFEITLPVGVADRRFITATASPTYSTSEFSRCMPVH